VAFRDFVRRSRYTPTVRKLALIVAIGKNAAIGKEGGLPWSYPEDRAHFARTIASHALIMGRRTFEEGGVPPGARRAIVISRSAELPSDVVRAPDLGHALEIAWTLDDEPVVIGGAGVFEQAVARVTHAFVTEIPESPEADTFFRFDPASFVLVSERVGARGERYLEYRRKLGD
jgi:dihydrofolate reductase